MGTSGLPGPVGPRSRRRRAVATLTATATALLCACTPPAEPREPVEPATAVELQWFAARADAQRQGTENLVDFYAEDVTLDHRALGADVAVGREEALRLIERRWARDTLERHPQGDPFVSVGAALSHERLDVGGSDHHKQVLVVTAFGPVGATAETVAVSELGWRRDDPGDRRLLAVDEFVRSYVAAWSTRDGSAAHRLYAPGARIVDSLLDVATVAANPVALAAEPLRAGGLAGTQMVQLPDLGGPAVFVAASTLNDRPMDRVGLVLTTPDDAECAQRVAVWLTLDADGLIESESRYHRLADLAACAQDVEVPTGWWEAVEVPDPIRTIQTGTVLAAGQSIDVFNGSTELEALILWGFERFESAGLDPPSVERITFYSGHTDRCEGVTGLIAENRIIFCFTTTTPCSDPDCAEWPAWMRATVLHELGHSWMAAELTAEARHAFLRRSGKPAWSSADAWGDRGVELAAETLAWGLMDGAYRVRSPLGQWSCADLADLFEILTGSPPDPVPACGDGS